VNEQNNFNRSLRHSLFLQHFYTQAGIIQPYESRATSAAMNPERLQERFAAKFPCQPHSARTARGRAAKPFSSGELPACVRALLHRYKTDSAATDALCQVTRDNSSSQSRRIPLAVRHAGRAGQGAEPPPFAKSGMGYSHIESNHYLRIYVSHLRQKLEDDPAQAQHFLTESGVGCRFQP
jgi:hypothetical protein